MLTHGRLRMKLQEKCTRLASCFMFIGYIDINMDLPCVNFWQVSFPTVYTFHLFNGRRLTHNQPLTRRSPCCCKTVNMAERSDLKWRVTEIATCPICLADFENSRMLPCVHSFCFKCLQSHCKNKVAGDDVACPVCRSEFRIPDTGLQGLPRNFFVQNLIDARDASTQKTDVLCEICAAENDEHERGEISSATMYCVDCNQKLCRSCSRPHKMWRGGPHQVRALGAELSAELIQQRASYCDQHKDERLKLYCHDCEINVCLMCFAVSHSGHRCDDVGKVADEFIKLFDSDIKSVSSRIDDFHVAVTHVDAENTKFLSAVNESRTSVQEREKKVNQIVKKHMTQLLQELQTAK